MKIQAQPCFFLSAAAGFLIVFVFCVFKYANAQELAAQNIVDTTVIAPGRSRFVDLADSKPSISADKAVFLGRVNDGRGIYTWDALTRKVNLVVACPTTAPKQTRGLVDVGLPAINGQNIVYAGKYKAGAGIYTQKIGEAKTNLVADRTTPVPQRAGNFNDFGISPSISGGSVAFLGTYDGGKGIYTGSVGAAGASLVADAATPVPGHETLTFMEFGNSSISGGSVAFLGTYDGGKGIFLKANGRLRVIINTGNMLFHSELLNCILGPYGCDGDKIAFSYALADGRSGNAVISTLAKNQSRK